MRHRLGGKSAGSLLVALAAWASPVAAQELTPGVESLIATSKLNGAKIGVSILDLSNGHSLADVRSDAAMIPASNMKLLTSGTALLVLGEEFLFRTEVLIDGDPTKGPVTVILRGSGDPALADPAILDAMSPKMSVDGLVETLGAGVAKAGVRRVSSVIVDDRIFDREYVHASWPKDQLDKWYCAEVCGLNFHTNVISAFPSPAPEGPSRPPTVAFEPTAPWLEIENRARTITDGSNSVWLARDPVANRFTLFGTVRFPAKVPIEITLHEVGTFTGQLIAAELPRAGVAVGPVPALPSDRSRLSRSELQDALATVRLAEAGEALSGRSVAVVTTHIRDVMQRCNNDSQNLYAESLIKRIGHDVTGNPGSWTSGSSVVRMTIAQNLGAEYAASTVVSDGSGMSREDRVAPRTLARWLDALQKNPRFGKEFVESLATPGDGTLRRRFGDIKLHGELRAKSGKLDGVRCLSGFLTDHQTGHRVAFSIMVNDMKEGEFAQALQFHEDVVALIDRWLVSHRPGKPAGASGRKPGKPEYKAVAATSR